MPEFFALLAARDKAREALAALQKAGAEAQATALTRALALEAARGAAPDRFVQALRQLATLRQQYHEQIKALREFAYRFDKLIQAARQQQAAEIEAALTAKIQQLEEQKTAPGARVEEIEAEIARWKKELNELKPSSAARTKPKPRRKA